MSVTMPMLRLDLEGLRYQVVHALAAHNDEIEKAVDFQLKQIIESADLRAMVQDSIRIALKESIDRAIKSAVWELFQATDIKDTLRTAILSGVRGQP